MDFKIGDKVQHTLWHEGKVGEIIDIINDTFVEVVCEGEEYYWDKHSIERLEKDIESKIIEHRYEPYKKCSCEMVVLMRKGCSCGGI